MRAAVVEFLKGQASVTDLVGQRIYVGHNAMGGVSRQLTDRAFDDDGDLQPSIVVKLGPRTPTESRTRDLRAAVQYLELWVYAEDYAPIYQAIQAVKEVLDFNRDLRPTVDPVAWAETRWDGEPQGEQLDPNLQPPRPVVMTRYAAHIRELLT